MTYVGSKAESPKKTRVIRARKALQEKIGTGQIDPFTLQKMQDYLDNLKIDYEPIAVKYLGRIDRTLKKLPDSEYDRMAHLDEIIKPVMELKSTGGMFNEHVISNISGIILRFLENVKRLDDEMIEIIRAHNSSIISALKADIHSLEDRRARALITEINRVCKRYYQKYKDNLE